MDRSGLEPPNALRAMFSLIFKVVWLYLINWLNKLQPLQVHRFRGLCTVLAVEEDGTVSPQTEHLGTIQEFVTGATETNNAVLFSGVQSLLTTLPNKFTNLFGANMVVIQIGCNNSTDYAPSGVCGCFFWRAVIGSKQIQAIISEAMSSSEKCAKVNVIGEIRGVPTPEIYYATIGVTFANKNL
jgi:hypothetical protein